MKLNLLFLLPLILPYCTREFKGDSQEKRDLLFHKVIYFSDHHTRNLLSIRNNVSDSVSKILYFIMDSAFGNYLNRDEYPLLIRKMFPISQYDSSGLAKSSVELMAFRSQVNEIVSKTFELCNKNLKNDSVIFLIMPFNTVEKNTITIMGGVSGFTARANLIILKIDFDVSSWRKMLQYALAHEFNHSYCIRQNPLDTSNKFSLLDRIVSEGKGDSFAHLLYPEVNVPWTSCLSKKEKTELWQKIKQHLNSTDPKLQREVMFGSEKYPIWGGYALGYDILQRTFERHPELLKSKWTDLTSENLLKMSGYQ